MNPDGRMTEKTPRVRSDGQSEAGERAVSRHTTPDDAEPPQAPEIPPRVRMYRVEAIGMAVIAVVPLLALIGVMGPTMERAEGSAGTLGLEVEYPVRYRLGMVETLEARVTNHSPRPLPSVTLTLDDGYLEGFATISPTPGFDHAYAVELRDLAPGETRSFVVDLEAGRAGRFRGRATAAHERDSVTVPLTTLVFP